MPYFRELEEAEKYADKNCLEPVIIKNEFIHKWLVYDKKFPILQDKQHIKAMRKLGFDYDKNKKEESKKEN